MQTVVVGTDGSPTAESAVRKSIEVVEGSGAVVHLVIAYPDTPAFSETIASSAKRDPINLRDVAESVVARAESELESHGIETVTHAREGEPAHVIIDVAQEQNADMIVVGATGLTGFRRFLLGSVSSKLAHHAPCTLMIVREA